MPLPTPSTPPNFRVCAQKKFQQNDSKYAGFFSKEFSNEATPKGALIICSL